MMKAELLDEVRASRTDLARLVEAASRDEQPYVVVPIRAVEAWQRREPKAWANVCAWLASQGKTVVLA
jgi:hypothetical protein